MPDSARPTSAMFFQIVKSVLTGDSSLRKITNHPGGKNFGTIFAYITSSAFREVLLKPNEHGILGKDIFSKSDWISPRNFLKEMKWVQGEKPSKYAVNMVTDIFNSFVQDGAMESRDSGETFEFKLKKTLEFPDDSQITAARESNKHFMMGIDDLIEFLPKTLANGSPKASRDLPKMQPLWEAMHNDPLVGAFRSVHIDNVAKQFPKLSDGDEFNYLEIGVFTGLGVIETIDKILERYSNITVNYNMVEDIEPLLTRATQKIEYHISNCKDVMAKKNIKINLNYINQELSKPVPLESNSIDVVGIFQVFHYMKDEFREEFIRDAHRMIKKQGTVCVGQSTSYSQEFPYPFTMIFSASDNFVGYPIKDEFRLITDAYFDSTKVSTLDSIWTFKKPTHK